jgi:hypothetical protein
MEERTYSSGNVIIQWEQNLYKKHNIFGKINTLFKSIIKILVALR